ncbi:hypothetical protein [Mesorhizobium sp. WSM3860]|uniref:hypothetical protein n=1 Tax=Mesorhizobium sp. WSM3860 TaxID=2029403 RepID=UPI0015970ED3|nr:hypothetical protein [Mesorhizobium sp. WSM3860]
MRQYLGSSLAQFAFACSIAIACAGAATGGERGQGHGAGGDHGNSAGSQSGNSNSGQHKGTSGDPSGSSGSPPSGPPSDDDGSSTATTGSVTSAAGASGNGGRSLDLPPALLPFEDSAIPLTVHPIEALPGVPDNIVRACREAIEQAAAQFGATSVRVSSAGSVRRLSRQRVSAPVQVSIDYGYQDNVETRQAPVGCELNANGSVIGLT